MLSIFPDLLIFGLLAPTIIRVVVGLVLLYFGISILFGKRDLLIKKFSEKSYPFANFMVWPLGILSVLSGGFLIAGFLTQIVAIAGAYLFLKILILDSGNTKILGQSWLFYVVMIFVSLSLLISGPGVFGIDLPL